MYCSNCGQGLNGNLNYCNSCGTRVERSAMVVNGPSTKPMAVAAIFIGGGGLFAFIPLLRELLHSGLDQAAIIIILGAYLLTVFSMFTVLIGKIWKHSGDVGVKGRIGIDDYAPPQRSFRSVNTAQLTEPHQPPASVTDHTTRTLEKVPLGDP